MAASEQYRRQAALLVRTIPILATETCFALKGGTAINLFVRDMPRLSVDIDLTYLPVGDRATSLANIDAAMRRLERKIREGLRGARSTCRRRGRKWGPEGDVEPRGEAGQCLIGQRWAAPLELERAEHVLRERVELGRHARTSFWSPAKVL